MFIKLSFSGDLLFGSNKNRMGSRLPARHRLRLRRRRAGKLVLTNLLGVLGDSQYLEGLLAKFDAISYFMKAQGRV